MNQQRLISVLALCGILFISWYNGMKILSFQSLLLFILIFIFHTTSSTSQQHFSSSSFSSLRDRESIKNSKTEVIQKQRLIYLDYLIEKNNNFHKKYKIKNSVSSYVAEYWQMDSVVSEEIAKFIQLIIRDFIDPWYQYGRSILPLPPFLIPSLSLRFDQ
jgi:hypothetical protein